MWGTWLSLARTMTEYDAATFLADGQHMISNLATVMTVLMIAAVMVGAGGWRTGGDQRGPPRFRDRATSRVPPAGAGCRWNPQIPSTQGLGAGPQRGSKIMAGAQPVTRPQHQGPVRFQTHDGERPCLLAQGQRRETAAGRV